MEHPTQRTLEAFRRGELEPMASLEVSDHLQACGECVRAIGGDGETADLLGSDAVLHLSEDEIALAAADTANLPSEAAAHLERCSLCREEVEELRQAVRPVAAAPRTSKVRRLPTWALAAAACLSVAAVLVGLVGRSREHQKQELVASLQDGDREIALAADGNLSAQGLSGEDARTLAAVLQDRRLPVSALPPLNAATQGKLRGESATAPSLELVSPVAEYAPAQPEFRWKPLNNATSYRVEVYDAAFQRVAQSDALKTTTWSPAQPLSAGEAYTWVVRAATPGGEIQAPKPPAPEARFETLPAAMQQKIDALRKMPSPSHLLLAACYAKAGLPRLAAAELDQLTPQNRRSSLLRDLAASLQVQAPPEGRDSTRTPRRD